MAPKAFLNIPNNKAYGGVKNLIMITLMEIKNLGVNAMKPEIGREAEISHFEFEDTIIYT